MNKDKSQFPIVPIILFSLVSLTGIILGVLPYIKKDLFQNTDIFHYALLGLGVVCLLSTLILLFFAGKISKKSMGIEEKEKEASVSAAPPPRQEITKGDNSQTVLLLSLLQEKGRFVDFVMGDITPYSDEQIGAAARVVHQGCNELIKDSFSPEAISKEKENDEVTLNEGYNTREYKITGDVIGELPYKGKLIHKGWRANHVKLPQLNLPQSQTDKPVIQPAEIEL